MSDLYDPKYGYSYEEIALLQEHDESEELHAYEEETVGVNAGFCGECGDTEEGLMHNNTWRNTEPLMED